MDFLGLRTLTVIQNAVRLAEKDFGVSIDIDHIDFDDKKVLESIGTGRTEGVFQLESAGMKGFMKELKPENLEDIIAGISLYRPGPMDFIPKYLKGKNDRSSITYDCPQLEPILSPTYGCIVYQEQVMQIVRDLAGYTMGRSDLVRRAMSKKKTAVMEKERQNFVYGNEEEGVKGCVAGGIDEKTANHIYDEMIDFAKYAFNKSHAAAYAVVSYQTAYLKYYYPREFMAALMTSVMDNVGKFSEYVLTCRRMMGISVLPPDINEGESGFSVSGKVIRYGLSGTIDLDIACTDYTIGFDTAVNTAMEAIDKIRDTSTSHERCSIVEVMGRNAGYIALWCGIANGAEDILLPERYDGNEQALINRIIDNRKRGKKHNIIINAEGIGHSGSMAKRIEAATGIETRATILGHMQRGGTPTCKDRVYASIMGARATELLAEGKSNRLVAYKNGAFVDYDIQEALNMTKDIPEDQYAVAKLLVR